MNNFWARTLTGAVFIAVILGAIYLGEWTFAFLLLAINALCILEYAGLFKERDFEPGIPLLIICSVSILSMALLSHLGIIGQITLVIPIVFLPLIGELFRLKPDPFVRGIIGIGGLIYITFPLTLFAWVAYGDVEHYSPHIPASIFYLVWASDTFAYLSGIAFGRTPLFPAISPKKTWEGSIGGALGAIGISVLLYYTIGIFSLPVWIGLAVVIVIFGTLGDLIESMLKRSLGLKDSGDILPGHGGVLDRFDAFLFAVPFAAAYIYLAGGNGF